MTDDTPTPTEDFSAGTEDVPLPTDELPPPPEEFAALPAEAPSPVAQPAMTRESQNWATAAHLSAFIQFLSVPSLVGPLIVWLLKKDDPYVEAQAKEALNFNISFFIYGIVAGLMIFVVIGIVLLPIVLITWFVLVIVASMAAARGEEYRYPLTMRLVN